MVVVADGRQARAERRSTGSVRRHRGDGGRRRRQGVRLLDDQVHRHLALETVDVALAEVVAQLVNLEHSTPTARSSAFSWASTHQGRSDGVYIGIYTPKISPSKHFMG